MFNEINLNNINFIFNTLKKRNRNVAMNYLSEIDLQKFKIISSKL